MKDSRKVAATITVLLVIAYVFAFRTWIDSGLDAPAVVEAQAEDMKTQSAPVQASDSWLKGTTDEKFAQIEKHFRGLDVTMAEIGYRYGELHHAAKERNWEYAKYQIEKIDLSLRLALERRPKRAASSQAFLNEGLPAVDRAIKSRTRPKWIGRWNNCTTRV